MSLCCDTLHDYDLQLPFFVPSVHDITAHAPAASQLLLQ